MNIITSSCRRRNTPPNENNNNNSREKWQKYIGALEEERSKIQVFERDLPLSLHLVTQAIERCRRQQVSSTPSSGAIADDCFINVQSNDHDHYSTTSGQKVSNNNYPVLEEYIPMKPVSSKEEKDDTQLQMKQQIKIVCSKDWLTSAQLSIPDHPPIDDEVDLLSKNIKNASDSTTLTIGVERRPSCAAAISSSAETDFGGGGCSDGGGDDKGLIRFNKKERRCWSPELHRRFLHALQELGGAHVATPKQIKKSMKVDGLTNDEIKSHLQKYRLHTRRSNPPSFHNDNAHTPHQLVLVGQIWMPPLEYITKTASSPLTDTSTKAKAIYTPIASLPPSINTTSLYKTNQCKQLQPYLVEKSTDK